MSPEMTGLSHKKEILQTGNIKEKDIPIGQLLAPARLHHDCNISGADANKYGSQKVLKS